MKPNPQAGPVAELAERMRSLSVADQIEVLREAMTTPSPASEDVVRSAAERVLREDREILDSLGD